MNSGNDSLPIRFKTLAPFVAVWGGIESSAERFRVRQRTSEADLAAFYDAGAPLLESIFEHLDKFSVSAALPPLEATLYKIALGIIEAGQFMEMYGGKAFLYTYRDVSKPGNLTIEFTT